MGRPTASPPGGGVWRKLAGQTGAYAAATALPQLARLLVLPVFTHYLSPEEFALLALAQVFASVAGIVLSLQVQSGVLRFMVGFLGKKQDDRAKSYLGGMLILSAILLALGCLALEFFGGPLTRLCFPKTGLDYAPLVRLSVIGIMLSTYFGILQSAQRALERTGHYLAVAGASVIAGTAAKLAWVWAGWGVSGVLWGDIVGGLAGCAAGLFLIRDWVARPSGWKDMEESVRYSLPLIAHNIAGFLFISSDRIILEKFTPLAAIGLYAVADRLASIPLTMVNTFNMAQSPVFLRRAEEDPRAAVAEKRILIAYWSAGVAALLVGAAATAAPLMRLFLGERFHDAAPLVSILCLSAAFRGLYCFAVNAVFFARKTGRVVLVTLTAGLVSVALNLVVVPRFGVLGAAWTNVTAYAVSFLMALAMSRSSFPIEFPWAAMAGSAAAGFLCWGGAQALSGAWGFGDTARLASGVLAAALTGAAGFLLARRGSPSGNLV